MLRPGGAIGWLTIKLVRFLPPGMVYHSALTRKMLYRLFYLSMFCLGVGFFRSPYVIRQVLQKEQQQKTFQEETVQETLSRLDINLSEFQQNYFVIISGNALDQKENQIAAKQRIAFELNAQINKKLEINQQFFQGVKFLFIGKRDIYELLQANNSIVQFYEKERERSEESKIFIFAREGDTEKMISSMGYKADLTSILRIISKHKARKFAEEVQF